MISKGCRGSCGGYAGCFDEAGASTCREHPRDKLRIPKGVAWSRLERECVLNRQAIRSALRILTN